MYPHVQLQFSIQVPMENTGKEHFILVKKYTYFIQWRNQIVNKMEHEVKVLCQ